MEFEKRKEFIENFIKNYPGALNVEYNSRDCRIIESDGSITRFAFYDEGEQMIKEKNWDPILKDAAIAAMSALIKKKDNSYYYTKSMLADDAVEYAQALVERLKQVGCYKVYL